ncbi:MAG: hypothetical protein EPO20_30595 [Betaproteobacteria bacterium]|nr:MAG: hypothetical protein EPO20_30595 [Betaproteobacteria bacterium]
MSKAQWSLNYLIYAWTFFVIIVVLAAMVFLIEKVQPEPKLSAEVIAPPCPNKSGGEAVELIQVQKINMDACLVVRNAESFEVQFFARLPTVRESIDNLCTIPSYVDPFYCDDENCFEASAMEKNICIVYPPHDLAQKITEVKKLHYA